MCEPQSRSKYLKRNSPPFPANKCCGRIEKGNDGSEYVSRRSSAGICKWVPTNWNTSDKIVKRSKKKSMKKPSLKARGGPSFSAKEFQGLTKKGSNGKMFISTQTKSGKWIWTPKVKRV
jgi:hypothetical protein